MSVRANSQEGHNNFGQDISLLASKETISCIATIDVTAFPIIYQTPGLSLISHDSHMYMTV